MRLAVAALTAMLLSAGAFADIFQLGSIQVNGLQRVSLGSVLRALPIQEGDQVDSDDAQDWIRALYQTGYFTDVRAIRDGDRLVFEVTERPAIASVEFRGNRTIPSDTLERVFSDVGLAEGEIYSQSLLEGLELELERQYSSQGRYNATVTPTITPLTLNRVRVELVINEGPVATIDHIEFSGNRVFTSEELRMALQMRETNSARYPFQWIARRNRFGQAQLSGDIARLEDYYFDRGYLDYRLESHQVSISDNKSDITLIYNLAEGEPYDLSGIRLTGDLVGLDEELHRLVDVTVGERYSRVAITNIQTAITDALGARGYAFADVQPQLIPDRDNLTVDVTLRVNPGKPVYVNRIEIRGNTSTNDEVIRRELRQLERALVINRNIRQSRGRLERLGYFSRVDIRTQRIEGRDDLVDIIVEVEETPSSTITGSVGYSDATGIFLEGRLDQRNFQGKGYNLSASVLVNETEQNYNLSFEDPYFTVSGVSRGIELFYKRTEFSALTFSTYATNTLGGRLSLGYPLSENNRINYSIGYSRDELFLSNSAPVEMTDFRSANGDEYENLDVRVSWTHNSLNGTFKATEGRRVNLTTELATPLGDLTYYRLTGTAEQYFPINEDYTVRLHTRLGYGDGYGDQDRLPFYRNFYSGGVRSVRGFRPGALGPLSTPNLDGDGDPLRAPSPIGGNIRVEYGAELVIPTPLVRDQGPFRTSLFLDAGNVFSDQCLSGNVNCQNGIDLSEIRYAAGIDLTWITPMAPLSFSYAWPLNAQEGDLTRNFAFTIGIAY
ncbi:MAG: outer membrane protein assembly factor BamA [Saccharospirillum sp.]|nr:outer membrane protein assembly factor BamA [Saccharospirillum sp.]